MKKTVSMLLFICMVLLIGCNTATPTTTEFADQQQFLNDMAKGIENRLAAVDDEKHKNDTDEQRAEYWKGLVKCELDKIEKYEAMTFSDQTFDRLAHHYISACKMQQTAAMLYKNKNLNSELWSSGRSIRACIITEFYSRYDLPLTGEAAASYSSSNNGSSDSYSLSVDGDLDIMSGITFYSDKMITYDSIKITRDGSQVLFNDQGVIIKLKSLEISGSEYTVNMIIENNGSSDSVSCFISNGYVDDYLINTYHPWGYVFVGLGKKGDTYSSFYQKDLEEKNMVNFNTFKSALYVITRNGSKGQYIAKIPIEISRTAFK